jgi:small subunit ribosomal protein S6
LLGFTLSGADPGCNPQGADAMTPLREYETIYVLRPDISDVDADRVTERMVNVIREHNGKVVAINNWGKRKLAYEIAKNQKGIYVHWRYVTEGAAIQELERNLRLFEPVLRFLTVKLNDDVDVEGMGAVTDDEIPLRAAGKAVPSASDEEDVEEEE